MVKKSNDILWIFLHVPKTGGTTFSDQIKAHLKPEEFIATSQTRYGIAEKADKTKFKDVRVLLGHATYYGIHKFFPEKSPRYIVFLREPTERLVSSYNFEMRTKKGAVFPFWKWYKLQQRNEVTSFMDMKFRGLPGTKANMPDSFSKLYSNLFKIKSVTYFFQGIFKIYSRIFKSSEKSSKRQLRNAKELLNRCWHIGIIPGLDKDLKFLFKQIGISTRWKNTNVTEKSKAFFKLDDASRKKIYEDNKYDKELFDYAVKLRNQKITK